MLNDDNAGTRPDTIPETLSAPPKHKITIQALHNASVDLLTVARLVVSVSLASVIQKELTPGSEAWMQFALLQEHARRAIAKVESEQ